MFIYLHGLNSAGTSGKAAIFRRQLAPFKVLTPTYPAQRPAEAISRLLPFIKQASRDDDKPLIMIGSSMGGFYAQYLARRVPTAHLYLINPALRPWELLPAHVGEQYNEATGERYLLTQDDVAATREFAVEQVCDGIATTLFLDRADEVIDYRIALALYANCGDLMLFAGGNHRFEHMEEAVMILRTRHCLGADS